MKILVTGGTGLVGSATVRRLLQAGHWVSVLHRANSDRSLLKGTEHSVHWLEGDILDLLSLEKAMADCDCVVHAAAVVSFVPRDQASMYKVNVEGTANVVNACLKAGISKLCHVSSVAALGRPDPRRITPGQPFRINERQRWEDSPANSAYAKTKYLAELEVWRGMAEGLPVVIVNPSLVLGEGDLKKSSTQIFNYVYSEKLFYTEGTVNYVDVEDIARAIETLIVSGIHSERFILSAGSASYKELFRTIAGAFGKRPPSVRVGRRLAGIIWRAEAARSWLTGSKPLITKDTARSATHQYVFDNSKIKEAIHFDFQPFTTTIERVCESFLKKE
jgi:dihydroflavonol-4-reductase